MEVSVPSIRPGLAFSIPTTTTLENLSCPEQRQQRTVPWLAELCYHNYTAANPLGYANLGDKSTTVSGCAVGGRVIIAVLFFGQGVLAGLGQLGVPRAAAARHGWPDSITRRGGSSRRKGWGRWGAVSSWSMLLFGRCRTRRCRSFPQFITVRQERPAQGGRGRSAAAGRRARAR